MNSEPSTSSSLSRGSTAPVARAWLVGTGASGRRVSRSLDTRGSRKGESRSPARQAPALWGSWRVPKEPTDAIGLSLTPLAIQLVLWSDKWQGRVCAIIHETVVGNCLRH
jgi:hypothetical protein